MEKQIKVGILGGTFDPIHMAHLILAEAAKEQYELDSIMIMPSGQPPHKTDREITDAEHRLRMVQLAIDDNKYLKASSIEIERLGSTYTSDTLSILSKENPNHQYYFIIGADSLFYIDSWHNPEQIFQSAVLLVAVRGDADTKDLLVKIDDLKGIYNGEIHIINFPHMDISSSLIRERVRQEKSIKYYVSKDVEKYIYQNLLYKD